MLPKVLYIGCRNCCALGTVRLTVHVFSHIHAVAAEIFHNVGYGTKRHGVCYCYFGLADVGC
jgi:hypothetical protein